MGGSFVHSIIISHILSAIDIINSCTDFCRLEVSCKIYTHSSPATRIMTIYIKERDIHHGITYTWKKPRLSDAWNNNIYFNAYSSYFFLVIEELVGIYAYIYEVLIQCSFTIYFSGHSISVQFYPLALTVAILFCDHTCGRLHIGLHSRICNMNVCD